MLYIHLSSPFRYVFISTILLYKDYIKDFPSGTDNVFNVSILMISIFLELHSTYIIYPLNHSASFNE